MNVKTLDNYEYKWKLEFSEEQIKELVEYSNSLGIEFFASVWDIDSVKLMAKYTKIGKIPSALITDLELCKCARENFEFLIISTGMSNEEEIEACINGCNPDVIMHTNSTYPCPVEELNLNYIDWLKEKWTGKEIGYSGHEYGLVTTFASVAKGVTWIERHITLDRNMWGSDQSSSIEPSGLIKLVKGIRDIEKSMKYEAGPRKEFPGELAKKKTLRG
jgi:N-acetylneuraminate synthase